MKKIISILLSLNFFYLAGQDTPRLLSVSEPSEPGWGVGTEFRTTTGLVGSHWDATVRMLYYDGVYILSIIRPASDDYFRIYEGDDCYLKLNTDEVVELPIMETFGVWNYFQSGYWVGNTYMPARYITQMFYIIPDISILNNKDIVKIRYFVNHSPRDIDIETDGNVKKFNRNMRESMSQAVSSYRAAQILDENPTAGF